LLRFKSFIGQSEHTRTALTGSVNVYVCVVGEKANECSL